MKEKLTLLAVAVAVMALVLGIPREGTTAAVEDTARATVSVTGEAEVRVVPDEVVLTLGIETHDNQLAVAKSQNDIVVKRVLALAAEFGIAPEHVQTDYIGIYPRYASGCYDFCAPIGYVARKSVVMTLRDLDRFEDLLTAALNSGANHVQGIEFRTTELRKYRDEARALAIRAAREKAEALAGELGEKAGRPRTIQEQQSSWWSGYGAWWGSSWGGAMSQNVIQEYGGMPLGEDSTVAPGQISVRASVAVTFELTD